MNRRILIETWSSYERRGVIMKRRDGGYGLSIDSRDSMSEVCVTDRQDDI